MSESFNVLHLVLSPTWKNKILAWLFPQKIKAVYLKDPQRYVTLQDIVEAEREAHAAQWPKVGATLALMWLKR